MLASLSANCPREQLSHVPAPLSFWKVPGEHAMQFRDPVVRCACPDAHAVQLGEFFAAEYFPCGHVLQVPVAAPGEKATKLPGAQSRQ